MKRIDRMFLPVLFGTALALGTIGVLEAREFTNNKGKTMEAELIGVAGPKATFKKPTGRKFSYVIDQLVEEDQAYIKEWAKTNVTIDMEVTKCRPVLVSKRRVGQGGTRRTIESRAYEITVKNNDRQPMGGLLCCYSLFTKLNDRYAGKDEARVQTLDPKHGKFEIPTIAAGEEKTFTTKPVIVGKTNTSERRGDVKYVANYTIKLAGGNFGFYLGERLVEEHHEGSFEEAGAPKPSDFDEEEADDTAP